jgi:cell division protein ZapA
MAQVTVSVNNRAYTIACDDGEEDHLLDLARYVDAQTQGLVKGLGQIGEARLLLMSALLIADQLAEADERIADLTAQLEGAAKPVDASAQGSANAAELSRMLENATRRIEALAARLEQT